MTRKHFYTLLITCLALLSSVTAQAGDNKWTLNADKTEWLYTYTTGQHPFVDAYNNQLYAVGQITFSFRNNIDANQKINDRWTDYHMRIGNPNDGGKSSGRVSVKAYYSSNGAVAYQDASNYFSFVYYNSNIDDNGLLTTPNEWVTNRGFWWDMDTQSSIKLFFQRVGGGNVEILRIPRPDDTGVTCYSTTEGIQRHYRTNLYNRYDANQRHLSKGVMYMKKYGDGTYLFSPVWDQFITTSGTQTKAKNTYVTALGWTGAVSNDKVVEAPKNKKTGKYELSIDALMPLAAKEERDNDQMHALFQAIVRAPEGKQVEMRLQYHDYGENTDKIITWQQAKVTGVGIDNNKTDNKAFGTVYPTGRVDYLKRIGNGGWLKLEMPAKMTERNKSGKDLETRGKMILTSDAPFQVSDIFMLWRPNQPGFYQTSANSNNALVDKDIDVSWIDLSDETKFSLFDRGANLNRVVKVGLNSPLGMEGHEHPCNVVVNGKMPLLYLTDRGVLSYDKDELRVYTGIWNDKDKNNDQYMKSGYTFGVNETFTADKVWFDRNFAYKKDANGKSHSMSTICLPFAMDATDLSKFKVSKAYEFKTANGNTATFQEVTSTEADKPYLIEPSEAISTANDKPLEFSNKQIPASKIADGDFIGTYKYRNLPATENGYGNYIFGFNTQKFNYVKSTGASFKPFRAYLRSKQSAGNLAKSIEFKIWDGSVTGIEQIDAKDNTPSHAPIYTIDGRMVSPTGNLQLLPQGIYIQNGKKIIK